MFYIPEILISKAQQYSLRINFTIKRQLGRGIQGMVFQTSNDSALKVHNDIAAYNREISVYGRLAQYHISKIKNFNIPVLKAFDNTLLCIEMSIVKPPFIVDFAGAYLDDLPEHLFDSNQQAEWQKERLDRFEENTNQVNELLAELEVRYKIFFTDVHPGNVRFV